MLRHFHKFFNKTIVQEIRIRLFNMINNKIKQIRNII